MSIVLGGLTLDESLVWTDRFKFSPVAQTTDRLLAGTLVVHTQGLQRGQPVTLEANDNLGWFTKAMVDQIRTWAASPGQVLTFDYHGEETHQVVFNHEEPPAVEFEYIVNRSPFLAADYFTGTIKLFTV